MPAREHQVEAANDGRRLDGLLRQLCPEVPHAALMRWLRRGTVRLNGRRSPPAARLRPGDCVRLPSLEAPPPRPRPRLPAAAVLHEDADLVVLDKPAGLACHAGTKQGGDSLVDRLLQHLDAFGAPPGHRPGLAQRLDRGVSGLVPAGKHAPALRALAAAVEAGAVDKAYVALVQGRPARGRGRIELPLRVTDQPMGNLPRTVVDRQAGLAALTHYEVLWAGGRASLLRLRLGTGRTHQIRAHLRALGHPLLADPRYGDAALGAQVHATFGIGTPLLHAATLALRHPGDGAPRRFVSPVPAAWRPLVLAWAGAGAWAQLQGLGP